MPISRKALAVSGSTAIYLFAGAVLAVGSPAIGDQRSAQTPIQFSTVADDNSAKIDDKTKISEKQLDQTAAAMREVVAIQDEYEQLLAAADPSEHEKITEAAAAAVDKAVTNQGLSVDEFNAIVKVALNDRDVREKIRQRLRE